MCLIDIKEHGADGKFANIFKWAQMAYVVDAPFNPNKQTSIGNVSLYIFFKTRVEMRFCIIMNLCLTIVLSRQRRSSGPRL